VSLIAQTWRARGSRAGYARVTRDEVRQIAAGAIGAETSTQIG
jgi:hypothetical protein